MEPFKNEFSYPKACRIAECVKRVHPAFSLPRFSMGLEDALEPLELKQRMRIIADRIEIELPTYPPELFAILLKSLGGNSNRESGLWDFSVWPFTEIVARRGQEFFEESMMALAEMTQRFTAEFAIRSFLQSQRDRTLTQMHTWCSHPDEHVRRLVSEGSRPLLPWGGNLPDLLAAPFPTFELLEKLYNDPSAYVRLSVSNHLNDFSKHHPELVIETLARWRRANPSSPHFEKLARHACRTLLKIGHPAALAFLGYGSASGLVVEAFSLAKKSVRCGEDLGYHIVIDNHTRQPVKVMFDYAIHYRKANGTLKPKVFKGRIHEITAGGRWEITGKHSFKTVTTRVYHPGIQRMELRLNGRSFPPIEFRLFACE